MSNVFKFVKNNNNKIIIKHFKFVVVNSRKKNLCFDLTFQFED